MNRHSPLAIGPLRLKNRVVVPAMASETADAAGLATETTVAHYRRLAGAGTGLLFVEYTYVDRAGRSEPQQLGAAGPEHAAGLARIAAVIRAAGGIPGLQLTHAGGKTERQYTDGRLLGPSGIAVPVKDRTLEAPETMSRAEITAWREAFVRGAALGVAAGFPVLELHAAHGYGFNQWLSPLTNRRRDEYGGALENRARLLVEVVREIKARFPGVVLSVRVPGQDHLPGGLTTDAMLETARLLVAAGVDVIDVSSGLGGWRRPRDREGEGYLVPEAAQFQAAFPHIPVIGVGGIETGAYIDAALQSGSFSMAAVGRAILKDPQAWGTEHLAIAAAVQSYIDGFLGQEAALLRQTFHADATLISVDEGVVAPAATAAWFDRIETKRANGGTALEARATIVGIDHAVESAVAKVEIELKTHAFTDYLALLKTAEGWRIVNKIYESRAIEA